MHQTPRRNQRQQARVTCTVAPLHACSGLLARMSTQLAREREEYARLAEEETDFERIVSMGLGPLDALDPEQEVLSSLLFVCTADDPGRDTEHSRCTIGSSYSATTQQQGQHPVTTLVPQSKGQARE